MTLELESSLRNMIDLLTYNNSIKRDIAPSKHAAITQLLSTSYQQIYDVINDHSLITTATYKNSTGELYAQLKLYNNGSYQCSVVFKPNNTDVSTIIPIEHDTFVALKNANGDIKQLGSLPIINTLLKLSSVCDMDIDQSTDNAAASDNEEEEDGGENENADHDPDDDIDEPEEDNDSCALLKKSRAHTCSCKKHIYKPIPVVEKSHSCCKCNKCNTSCGRR